MNGYSVFPFVLATLSALGFSWPLVARAAQLSPIMTAITYVIGSAAAIGIGSKFFSFEENHSVNAIALGIVAGLFNGGGMIAYSIFISSKEKWEMSTYWQFLSACIFFAEPHTKAKRRLRSPF